MRLLRSLPDQAFELGAQPDELLPGSGIVGQVAKLVGVFGEVVGICDDFQRRAAPAIDTSWRFYTSPSFG